MHLSLEMFGVGDPNSELQISSFPVTVISHLVFQCLVQEGNVPPKPTMSCDHPGCILFSKKLQADKSICRKHCSFSPVQCVRILHSLSKHNLKTCPTVGTELPYLKKKIASVCKKKTSNIKNSPENGLALCHYPFH